MTNRTWYWPSGEVSAMPHVVLPMVLILLCDFGTPGSWEPLRAAESTQVGEDPPTDAKAAKQLRADRLAQMRLCAEATRVCRSDDARVALALLPGPVFRYNDQPREIHDATLWCWGSGGRPLALQKVELYRGPDRWFYCFTSLSQGLLEVEWRDGHRWSARKPGLELRQLPDMKTAVAADFGRLLQMKGLAKRFSVTTADPPLGIQEKMRLLPRPIQRYQDPKSGLQDGAIFAFAANGTNPDLLLLIEVHGEDLSRSVWKYGLVRMTMCQLDARLDDEVVWSVPYMPFRDPNEYDTWLFFTESGRSKGRRTFQTTR